MQSKRWDADLVARARNRGEWEVEGEECGGVRRGQGKLLRVCKQPHPTPNLSFA